MCGIIGVFNNKDSFKLVIKGLDVLKQRGKDGFGAYDGKLQHACTLEDLEPGLHGNCVGHCLHSVVGNVGQPMKKEGVIVSNCEIYNWRELAAKNRFDANNDSELLLLMLDRFGVEKTLDLLDGDYAFAYWNENKVIIARDIIGVKPLCYCANEGFSFASEKKALEKLGFIGIEELNPRKIVVYDIKEDKIRVKDRRFFDINNEIKDNKEKIKEKVNDLLVKAVKKRIPDKKLGILFSGGVDSTTLLQICKNVGKDVTLYTAAVVDKLKEEPQDLAWAEKAAKRYCVKLRVKKIKPEEVEGYLKKIVPIIEDNNAVKVGVALTFYLACELARKDECKVVFSGLGSEEIFAGYERHKLSHYINKECVSGLLKMYERDLYRDDTLTMSQNLELRVPFLDKALVEYSLKIPGKYKLADDKNKIILREVAEGLGVYPEFAWRKKRAAQYGSNTHKALKKLAKKQRISEYLRKFYPRRNLRLAALFSSGKDSSYALHVMQKQNYEISCLVTIRSRNKDSYMYHTPNIEMTELQAKAMGIPLIMQESEGEKEKELEDLEKALKKAKSEFWVEGVVTGALYSNYQRERIEKICDKLGLKVFSPLWHMDQEQEMRELVKDGFEFILSSIAAYGLDESWLGRVLTDDDIDKLVEINKKIGINIAFEGGEAESLVLNGPMFANKIVIKKARKIMENKFTGRYFILEAGLE